MRGQWAPGSSRGGGWQRLCSRREPPWGQRGGVPRGEHGTHSEGRAGDNDCGAAAPFSVLAVYCCRLLSINMCEFRSRVWTHSHAAGGHL